MYRECLRCRLTLPLEDFPHASAKGHLQLCSDCWSANPVVQYVAYLAVDALTRLRAIDALLYLGYVHAARLIARGATDWPSLLQLREGIPMPRQPLWWISLDADTIALLRMLLRTPDPARTPRVICAA